MKTLKKYQQFCEVVGYRYENSLEEILNGYMERFHGEYDYIVRDNDIEIFHVDDPTRGGEPDDDLKNQIADDNRGAANQLTNLLNSKGWGVWEFSEPTFRGFTVTKIG